MREAGVDIRVQTAHLGSVGFQESLSYVRPLRLVMEELRQLLRIERPDVAVLVDNEGFNVLLAKFLHREGIPFIYYFPPQVWLWGEWRARAIARKARAIIAAFPEEARIYRRDGGRVAWFGHPLLDIVKPGPDAELAMHAAGLDPSRRTIALMPGSRYQELEALLPPMLGAVRLLNERYRELQVILPAAASHLLPTLKSALAKNDAGIRLVTRDIYALLSRCELAILSSGTATLECALLGLPMVVSYKVKPLTYFLGKRLLKARFITMPNILLDRGVVPELLQGNVTADRIFREAVAIMEDPARAAQMRAGLAEVRTVLGGEGTLDRAAAFVLDEARSPLPAALPALS